MVVGVRKCHAVPLRLRLEGVGVDVANGGDFRVSDLGVGVINFLTGIRGAWMNVKINLPGVKDEAFAAEAEAEGKRILAEGEQIADRLYKAIEEEL